MRDKSEQEPRMELVTGGVVEMWSLDKPESALGRACRRVVIDEAATANKLLYCWQQIFRPMLTNFAGDAWFISTPKGFGDFWTLYQWG